MGIVPSESEADFENRIGHDEVGRWRRGEIVSLTISQELANDEVPTRGENRGRERR